MNLFGDGFAFWYTKEKSEFGEECTHTVSLCACVHACVRVCVCVCVHTWYSTARV